MIFLRTLVLAKRLFGFLTQIRLVRQHWTLQKVCCYSNKGREDAAHHTEEYRQAGLPGCVGSTDAPHILLEEVEYRLQQNHLGFKTSHTARTYNIANDDKYWQQPAVTQLAGTTRLLCSMMILLFPLIKVGRCKISHSNYTRGIRAETLERQSTEALGWLSTMDI